MNIVWCIKPNLQRLELKTSLDLGVWGPFFKFKHGNSTKTVTKNQISLALASLIWYQINYHSNPVWRVDERQDDESVALERSSSERLFASASPSQADVMGWVRHIKRVRGLETKGVQVFNLKIFNMKQLKVMIALKLCLLWERFWCVCVLGNHPNRGWYLNLIMHGWFDGCRGAWAESKNRWHLQRGWHRWRCLSLRCLPVMRSELHCPREFEKGGTCLLGKLLRSNRLKPITNN